MSPAPVRYTSRARRDLRRLDPQVASRILAAIDRLAEGNRPGDVRRLKGRSELRLRVGDWRVRFERDEASDEVLILRVLHRSRAYER